ncbi:MAG: hypothetical protein U0900_23950 [Myxococcota bacterium]
MSRRHPGARSLGGLRPSLAFPRAASRALALLLVLALGSACTTSQGKPKPASPVPVPYQLIAHPVDRSTLSLVERRGYDLYVRDLAASRATNAALSEIAKHKFG